MADTINTLPHDHGNLDENLRILDSLPDAETISEVSESMKTLGDPSRLRLFWILCHVEECVINLAAIMNMSSPAVSHHLRLLKAAGLITSRRDGKEMYYRASDTELTAALHIIIENVASITCPDE